MIKGWMCKLEEIVSSTTVDTEILFSKPVLFFESTRQRFGVDNLMVVANCGVSCYGYLRALHRFIFRMSCVCTKQ